jgi:hypothetical protein
MVATGSRRENVTNPCSCIAVRPPLLWAWCHISIFENLDQPVLQEFYLTSLSILVYLAGETQLDLSSPISFCFSILYCVSDQHYSSCTSSPLHKQTNKWNCLVVLVWNELEFWEIRRVCSLLENPISSPNSVLWILLFPHNLQEVWSVISDWRN